MRVTKSVRYIKLNVYRRRRTLAVGVAAVVLALLLMAKRQNHVRFISGDMQHVRPHELWEYVSDFSNMMKLNPTITKFTITHETSDHKQWNYTVEYEEHLSQLSFVTNKIVGTFVVDKSQPERTIGSNHRTCFATYYCLDTQSTMAFQAVSDGTRIVESIGYECPWLLTRFCANEVTYQRKMIFGQLRSLFASNLIANTAV